MLSTTMISGSSKPKSLVQSLQGVVLSGGETGKFYTARYGLHIADCDKASFVYRK